MLAHPSERHLIGAADVCAGRDRSVVPLGSFAQEARSSNRIVLLVQTGALSGLGAMHDVWCEARNVNRVAVLRDR